MERKTSLFNFKADFLLLQPDLWGRGYTESPLNEHHDGQVFSQQIFFATASSSLSLTGESSGGFSIIGHSFGGAIVMFFAARFPSTINSVVLLAPVGIVRQIPPEYQALSFRYLDWMPGSYVQRKVGKLLGVNQ